MPDYEGMSFSNIPNSILEIFGLKERNKLSAHYDEAGIDRTKHKKVILFLIDGFGYNQWQRYADKYPFLARFFQRGKVAPLTTIFPSTTSAAITTINSGLTPQEHGLLEWRVYFEELDKIVQTLFFTPLGEEGRDKLVAAGVNPKMLFDGETIYQTLAKAGIPSYSFKNAVFANSAYNKSVHVGSTSIPFASPSDCFTKLKETVLKAESPSFSFVYFDAIDSISHAHGPHSEPYYKELDQLMELFQKNLIEGFTADEAEDIAVIITADHGLINVDPEKTTYLNQFPEVEENLSISPNGNKIMPWGSPRDMFLSVREDKLDFVFDFLTTQFKGEALIVKSQEALADGWFGHGKIHPKFKSRIGNLLVLPYGTDTIWYKHFPDSKFHSRGIHGGLTADEMLSVLAAAPLRKLIK